MTGLCAEDRLSLIHRIGMEHLRMTLDMLILSLSDQLATDLSAVERNPEDEELYRFGTAPEWHIFAQLSDCTSWRHDFQMPLIEIFG